MATGHIRKKINKDKTVSYQLIVETSRDITTGKRERQYKTLKGCTKKQAEAELRRLIAEVEAGSPLTTASIKLSAWMDEWLNTYVINVEATTKAGYEEKIRNYIKPEIGHIPVNALNTHSVQKWVNDLSQNKGLASKTIKNAYQNLNAAMKKAVELKMIASNPCAHVVLPKAQKKDLEVYTADEIKQILNLAKGTDFYLSLLLLTTLGLRRGELAGLRWNDIDLKEGTIIIRNTIVTVNGKPAEKAPKSQAGNRTLSIGNDLLQILKTERLNYFNSFATTTFNATGYVIHKEDGTPYNPDSITQKWERFCERNNLRKIRLHDLRHSCATLMIANGVDVKTVQHRLGHADISITMNTYAHCTPQMDKAAAEKIDTAIFKIA